MLQTKRNTAEVKLQETGKQFARRNPCTEQGDTTCNYLAGSENPETSIAYSIVGPDTGPSQYYTYTNIIRNKIVDNPDNTIENIERKLNNIFEL